MSIDKWVEQMEGSRDSGTEFLDDLENVINHASKIAKITHWSIEVRLCGSNIYLNTPAFTDVSKVVQQYSTVVALVYPGGRVQRYQIKGGDPL